MSYDDDYEYDEYEDEPDDDEEDVEYLTPDDLEPGLQRLQRRLGRGLTAKEVQGIWNDSVTRANVGDDLDVEASFADHWRGRGREPWDLDQDQDRIAWATERLNDMSLIESWDEGD